MVPKTCSISECERAPHARALCNLHYRRWKSATPSNLREWPTDKERFMKKVKKTSNCWEWEPPKNECGYGRFWFKGSNKMAHRVSYELQFGPIPEGQEIDHRCHNHGCVNPAHLRPATRKQNMENRVGAQSNSKSGVRGVRWVPADQRWRAQITHRGKVIYVGNFLDIHEAESAVISKRLEMFTHKDIDREGATP